MSAHGWEMCGCAGYAALMRDWEQADAWEAALEREIEWQAAELDALPVTALLRLLRDADAQHLARLAATWARAAGVQAHQRTDSLLRQLRLFAGPLGAAAAQQLGSWLDAYASEQAERALAAEAAAHRRGDWCDAEG